MRRIFVSSVQKEFERERAAIKRMIESDPILKPHFKAFVFEIDAPAADKTTQQVYLKEIEKSDIYLVLIGNKYGYCDEGGVSPTEQEFDRAKELGLTTLVMVRGRDDSKREEREARFLKKVSDGRVRHVSGEVYRDAWNWFDGFTGRVQGKRAQKAALRGSLGSFPCYYLAS